MIQIWNYANSTVLRKLQHAHAHRHTNVWMILSPSNFHIALFYYVCSHWFSTHMHICMSIRMFIDVCVLCICFFILLAKCVRLCYANSISWHQCHFCHFSQCIQNLFAHTHTHALMCAMRMCISLVLRQSHQ